MGYEHERHNTKINVKCFILVSSADLVSFHLKNISHCSKKQTEYLSDISGPYMQWTTENKGKSLQWLRTNEQDLMPRDI